MLSLLSRKGQFVGRMMSDMFKSERLVVKPAKHLKEF